MNDDNIKKRRRRRRRRRRISEEFPLKSYDFLMNS